MRKISFKIMLSILLLIIGSASSKVQCQLQPNNWVKGKHFNVTEREYLVSTIYGVDVIVDGYDGAVSKRIINQGQWQAPNLRSMAQFVSKGNKVINVGSHIGLQAIVLGKIVGQTGRVFIFEPWSVSFNMLLKNIYLNGLGDIATAYNVAGGNKRTQAFNAVGNGNTGGASVWTKQTAQYAPFKTEQVQVDLVDNILPKDTVLDFALIDVQRSEIECLQGMKQTIARSPNLVIMCEWSGQFVDKYHKNQQPQKLLKWFLQRKYKFYKLDYQKDNCQKSKYFQMDMKTILDIRYLLDIFFVPSHIDPNKLQ